MTENQEETMLTQKFPIYNPVRIYKEYTFTREIGRESCSVVYLTIHKASKMEYAVKMIEKSKRDPTEEILILLQYGSHPHIVTLKAVHEDDKYVYLVLEFLRGDNLLDLNDTTNFSEKEIAEVIYYLTNVVHYLHENEVVNMDLSPSNIRYKTGTDPKMLCLCNLSFAKKQQVPEIFKMEASHDIWLLGALLYIMLTGYPPFHFRITDDVDYILNCSRNTIFLKEKIWTFYSNDLRNLLTKMLHPNYIERPTAAIILEDPWIKRFTESVIQNIDQPGPSSPMTVHEFADLDSDNDEGPFNNLRRCKSSPDLKTENIETFVVSGKSSPYWDYFRGLKRNDKIIKNKLKCILCEEELIYRGWLSQLTRHIEKYHPEENKKIVKIIQENKKLQRKLKN